VLDRGIRSLLFIDFVEWALYHDRQSGLFGLAVRVLYGDLPDEMPASLQRILARNLSAQKLAAARAIYHTLQKNDVVTVDGTDAGCRVSVNGRELLYAPGFDLFGELASYVTGRKFVRPAGGG